MATLIRTIMINGQLVGHLKSMLRPHNPPCPSRCRFQTVPFKKRLLENRTTAHPPTSCMSFFYVFLLEIIRKGDLYCVSHEENTVVNTIYLVMLDYEHRSSFLKGNKPGNLSVKDTRIMSYKAKIPQLLLFSCKICLVF